VLVKSLDLKEFRGVRGLSKPIELEGFTVLIGRNNVGKTSILEALYLLAWPFQSAIPPYGASPIGVISTLHGGSSSLVYGYAGEALIEYNLASSTMVSHLGLMVNGIRIAIKSNGSSEVLLNVSSSIVSTVKDIAKDILSSAGNYQLLVKSSSLIPSSTENYQLLVKSLGCGFDRNLVALYIPNDTGYYNELRSFVLKDEVLRWIEKSGFHRRVAEEYISRVVYDRFTEVLKRGDRLALRKEVSGGVGPLYIDIDSIGEGVKRFVLTYFAVEYLNPKIVLWDDIEVAAHPSLLELIVKWLSESGRQVVISTHSLDVLYALTLVKPKNAAVVVLRKTADDVVEWRKLSIDELEEILGKGVDVRLIVDELEM